MITSIDNVQGAVRVQMNAPRRAKFSTRCRTTVTAKPSPSCACDRTDNALRIYPPNAMVSAIGHKYVALLIHCYGVWICNKSCRSKIVIASIAIDSCTD